MTNEELVKEIQSGINQQENMKQLYFQNIGLLRSICLKFAHNEEMEDLLQEAFFGLYEAVKHYESDSDVLFMTYAPYWIRQRLRFYTINSGHLIRIPAHALGKVKLDICSLDCPVGEDGEETLCDFIQADLSVENDVCEQIYQEQCENELWGIVGLYTDIQEREIIIDRFINHLSYRKIGEKHNISHSRVRDIEQKALRKLRMGKARRKLASQFDVIDTKAYKGNGVRSFKENNCTSNVELLAMSRAKLEEEYKQRLAYYGLA